MHPSTKIILALAALLGIATTTYTIATYRPPERQFQRGTDDRPPDDPELLGMYLRDRPQYADGWLILGRHRRHQGRTQAAAEVWAEAERALAARARDQESPGDRRLWFVLGWARHELDRAEDARAAFEVAARLYEEDMAADARLSGLHRDWNSVGWVRLRVGDDAGARAAFARSLELYEQTYSAEPSDDGGRWQYDLACYRALAGDPPGALEALSLAIAQGFTQRTLLENDRALDSLRENETFRDMVRALPRVRVFGG